MTDVPGDLTDEEILLRAEEIRRSPEIRLADEAKKAEELKKTEEPPEFPVTLLLSSSGVKVQPV